VKAASKVILLILLTITLLSGCKSTNSTGDGRANAEKTSLSANREQTGYLYSGIDNAIFIQWAKADQQIKGQMQTFHAKSKREGHTDSDSHSFEGLFDGENISLTVRGNGLEGLFPGRTSTGTLKGNRLTLVWPASDGTLSTTTLQPATVEDFNQAVVSLKEQAEQIRQSIGKHAYLKRNGLYLGTLEGSGEDNQGVAVWIVRPPGGYPMRYLKSNVILKDHSETEGGAAK
jgi:hypothetical protein